MIFPHRKRISLVWHHIWRQAVQNEAREIAALLAGRSCGQRNDDARAGPEFPVTQQENIMSVIERRLEDLGIILPSSAAPVANYLPFKPNETTAYISGQLSSDASGGITGIVGVDTDLDQAKAAARLCGINLIAQFKAACGGDLDRLQSILRLGAFVQTGPGFYQIPQVVNGCSDLMVGVFGDRGRHARSAVGVFCLPLGYSVEVDAVIEIAA
jgi:enamine deaminase RidA (YjgF/YER057c/UK114 family)